MRNSNIIKIKNKLAKAEIKKTKLYTKHASMMASGSVNGSVVLWKIDTSVGTKQDRIFHQQNRTITRVIFCPFNESLILSSSQDGTIKLYDIREMDNKEFCSNPQVMVRDISFIPTNRYHFLAALDNGNVQMWDIRNSKYSLHKFCAHFDPVFSLDWHVDNSILLATGGRDRYIRIWKYQDGMFSLDTSLQTTESVSIVRWRPYYFNQISSCSLLLDYNVKIWNTDRPHSTYSTFNNQYDVVTDMEWSRIPELNRFYICDRFGDLTCYKVSDGVQELNYGKINSVACGVKGNLMCSHNFRDYSVIDTLKILDEKEKNFLTLNCELTQHVGLKNNFINLAKNYKLTMDSPNVLCNFNYNVAKKLDENYISNVWKIIECYATYYLKENLNGDTYSKIKSNLVISKFSQPTSKISPIIDKDGIFNEIKSSNVVKFQFKKSDSIISIKNEAFETRQKCEYEDTFQSDVQQKSLTLICDKNIDNSDTRQHQKCEMFVVPSIIHLLKYLANIGDVQTCCSIYIILLPMLVDKIDKEIVKIWMDGYIELLGKHQLWNIMIKIVHLCKLDEIIEIYTRSLFIKLNIPIKIENFTEYLPIIECSVCQIPVKTLYTWCLGCSHGGHIQHMKSWFKEFDFCPSGCDYFQRIAYCNLNDASMEESSITGSKSIFSFKDNVLEFIACTSQPYNIVEHPTFKNLFKDKEKLFSKEFSKSKILMSSEAKTRELVDVKPPPESKKSRFARFYAQINEKKCEGIDSDDELNLYLSENTKYLENESILKWCE
ncbi:WD repeat-containing protein 24 [Intoshia linei]|uniref:GATOR2 complex protein WDR24 n=1 Tax=Intoshia linei TaxID=1819745 RepID=A0A177AYK2_9BILA|nr:WD repeat-containing protein 24 [Intoshia linei]